MSSSFITAAVLLFVAVVLGCQGAWVWWNSRHGAVARRLEARLEALAAGGDLRKETLSILKSRHLSASPRLERVLRATPGIYALDACLVQAGLRWSVARLIATCVAFALIAFAGGSLVRVPPVAALAAAAVCALLPLLYVLRRRARRLRDFERQLPEVCDMLARALRSGHAFTSAIDLVGTEFAEPAGGEFRITFDEINYGVSLHDALTGLASRVPANDLRYLVIAVLIQRETGGNLADLLDSIANLVRERFKLFEKVRVLSAEGRLSAWVLGVLPIATGALINVINPDYLSVLWTDPLGVRLIELAVLGLVVGAIWVRQTVKIRV